MQAFKDTTGRVWEITINVAQDKRCRGLVGVNLSKLIDNQMAPLAELLADPVALVDVLYVLCKDQAEKAKVTDEDFGAALGGDVLDQAAQAFLGELIDFFPKPEVRAALRKLIQKSQTFVKTMIAHDTETIDKLDAADLALKEIALMELEKDKRKTARSTGTHGSTRLPVSSGSTPAPSP